jgi:hypothetical protein
MNHHHHNSLHWSLLWETWIQMFFATINDNYSVFTIWGNLSLYYAATHNKLR